MPTLSLPFGSGTQKTHERWMQRVGQEGPRAMQALRQKSLAWKDGHPPRPPRGPAHRMPPTQAQRQALQAGLAVRQPTLAQVGQHGEGAAVTGLQTGSSFSARHPQPASSSLPTPGPLVWVPGAGGISWGTQHPGGHMQPGQGKAGQGATAGWGPAAALWGEARAVPWPAHRCSPRAPCTASRRTWRSGCRPAQSTCPGTAPPGSSTGLLSRC